MTIGQKFADTTASMIGSWRFICVQTSAITFWVLLNTLTPVKPDAFPFTFLNLMLSFQAAYTGPVLLMAANRQAQIDRQRAIDNFELDKLDHNKILAMLESIEEIEIKLEESLKRKDQRRGR